MARLAKPNFRSHFTTTSVVEVDDLGNVYRKLELAETSHDESILVHFRCDCWAITHKPTGLLVNRAHSREQALSMCAGYYKSKIDWSGNKYDIQKQFKGLVVSDNAASYLGVPNRLHITRSDHPLNTYLVTPVEVRPRTVAPS